MVVCECLSFQDLALEDSSSAQSFVYAMRANAPLSRLSHPAVFQLDDKDIVRSELLQLIHDDGRVALVDHSADSNPALIV